MHSLTVRTEEQGQVIFNSPWGEYVFGECYVSQVDMHVDRHAVDPDEWFKRPMTPVAEIVISGYPVEFRRKP